MPRKGTAIPNLLADPDIRRWYDNLSRGSRATADINLRRLAAVCASLETTPGELARLDERELHNRFLDFISREEVRGVSGSYIVRTIKAAKSWLLHNGVRIQRPLKVRGSQETPSLKDERVPTPEELRAILLAAVPRVRASCALLAFSGLRPEVLGNYLGTDGLRLGDFPELVIGKKTLRFEKTPTIVHVRPELSKNSSGYLTFLSAEGCEYVLQYLEIRRRAGEKLSSGSDFIHPERANKQFIRTLNIGDGVRSAIRGAGFTWRPYVLRHYFDTQLLTAESRGKLAHDFRVYWMGHVGSIDARYTTNKRRLPTDLIEEMRNAYKRCEQYLSTSVNVSPADEAFARAIRLLLTARGVPPDIVDGLDLAGKSDRELEDILKKIRAPVDPERRTERAVPVDDVQKLLDAGWEFVSPLNGTMAVVRAPSALNGGVYPPARRAE